MKEFSKSYSEYYDLRNDGSIVIYKRAIQTKRPKYNCRIKPNNQNGYIFKSTKSSDLEKAKLFATNLYYEIEGKIQRGESLLEITFSKLIQDWKKNILLETDKSRQYNIERVRNAEVHLVPYFNLKKINEIDEDLIREYFYFKNSSDKKYSPQTLRQHGTILRNILLFAKRKGYLNREIPSIALPKLKINPRPDFNKDEYRKLIKFMRTWVDEFSNTRITRDRYYLSHAVLILANTGMRLGELRNIKWSDIEKVKDNKGEDLISIFVTGKTGSRYVIANMGTDKYFADLYDYRTKELDRVPNRNDFVFINNLTNKPIHSFRRSFRNLLDSCGLTQNDKGQSRVIYSLRHTYVTMRLSYGVNIYQLANNIGSSVEMIEKFYGKKRNKDPRNVTEITKTTNKKISLVNSNNYPWDSNYQS